MDDPITAIRTCSDLFLQSVSEPDYNEVQVVLLEGRLGRGATPEEIEENPMLAKARLVEHGPGCQIFVLSWPIYVAYAVENESYANPEPESSVGERGRISVFTQSLYLDHLSRATRASANHPGPFKHWAMYCANHVVNVASTEEPEITVSLAV